MRILLMNENKLVWEKAQIGEKSFWVDFIEKNPDLKDEEWLKYVLNCFEIEDGKDFGEETLVDIGSGPIGLLTRLNAKTRIAVDPLDMDNVDKSIQRIKAIGEELTLANNFADKVFLYNVLQHVWMPEKVLSEVYRVLKPDGTAHILEQLNLPTDNEHPHSLKLDMFENWLDSNNFTAIKKAYEVDHDFSGIHKPGSGHAILCLIIKKGNKDDCY
jgi:SAM-dependent methyltransferase